jgi:hypothetical protein
MNKCLSYRPIGSIQSNLNLRAPVVSFKKPLISETSHKSNLKHRLTSILEKKWRHILDKHTTSLIIHDGNDEIDDMEEKNDVSPVKQEKPQ